MDSATASTPCMLINSTPVQGHLNGNFLNTQKALAELQKSLRCQHCQENSADVYHLGNCLHCFCRSCAEPKVGKLCPLCGMPPDASKARVNLQLSNISSLCQQMFNLFDDNEACTLTKRSAADHSELREISTNADASSELVDNDTETELTKLQAGGEKEKEEILLLSEPQNKESESKRKRRNVNKGNMSHQADKEAIGGITKTRVKPGKNTEVEQICAHTKARAKSANNKKDGAESDKTAKAKTGTKLLNHVNEGTPIMKTKSTPGKKKCKSGGDDKEGTPSSIEAKGRGRHFNIDLTPKAQKLCVTPKRTNRKGNISKRNAKGETPLHVATIKADLNGVRELLEAGANPNVKDNAGWTPLHEAVNHGNVNIAALLIDNGASVNTPGLENDTPLHDAISNHRLECVRLLVSKGANIYLRNSHGQTPLDVATTDKVKMLLLSGVPSHSSTTESEQGNDQSLVEEMDQNICILTSVLKKEENLVLEQFNKLFKSRVVQNYNQEVTHLIPGTDADDVPARTMKYLASLITGKWIVSSQWLRACLNENKTVCEKAFLLPGSTGYPNSIQKAVENRLKQLPRLFDGCQFYLYSKFRFVTMPWKQIAELIKLGGGVILSREPRLHNLDDYPYTRPYHAQNSISLADCTIYKIYDDYCSDPPTVQSQRMSCLPLSWLLDSITAFTLLEKNAYVNHT